MTTEGSLLPVHAQKLKEAGMQHVTASRDSLDDQKFGEINGRGVKPAKVLKGIEAAQQVGMKVKVNVLIKRGFNEEDIIPLIRKFQGTGIVVRFIEFMDVGN